MIAEIVLCLKVFSLFQTLHSKLRVVLKLLKLEVLFTKIIKRFRLKRESI